MNGNKVLITGGFGNLGSWIALHLAKQGYDIYILTRKENYQFEGIDYTVIECDLTDLKKLKQKLNFEIDFCIHTASYNEFFLDNYSQKALEINALGTRNLLETLNKKKIQNFIYFSTFHVYGVNTGVVTEETPLNPRNDYASTHLFAEYYIKQFGLSDNLKFTILRLTNSYGCPTFIDSSKWYLVLNDLTKMAHEKKEIILHGDGEVERDFIYMGDVEKVINTLLKKKATNEIFNLSSNKSHKIIEIANTVKKEYEKRYKSKIEIKKDITDRLISKKLNISNIKLKKHIDFNTTEAFEIEIEKIFKLLEMQNER